MPHGRYDASGPVRGGDKRSVSPRGVYDMAGNVREWTVNAREPGSRYILGGGWSDPAYLFSELYVQRELDRSPINGIRLVRRTGTSPDLARASAPIPGLTRDYARARPVDDATFRAFLALYDYDHTPLNAKVVARDSSAPDWVREEVEFDVPGDGLRMLALVFLPRRVAPPYQTVCLSGVGCVVHARSPSAVDVVRGLLRAQRSRPPVPHLRAHLRPRIVARRRRQPGQHDQASRPDDPLGARDAPLGRLRGDAPRRRHAGFAFAGASWAAAPPACCSRSSHASRRRVLDVSGLSDADPPGRDPVEAFCRASVCRC